MDYDSSMMTLNFASSGTDVFVTGVAYTDLDGDAFYSIGEGQSDVWITVDGANTTTTASGGYGLGVRAAEDLQVLVGQGGITLATLQVDASGGNVKVDVVTATDNTQSLMVSADTVLGFVPLSKSGAELLFEVISQCYERGSIIITSNLPFDEWTEVFGSERLTGALLDRLTHHVHILEMNGESYRLKHSRKAQQ